MGDRDSSCPPGLSWANRDIVVTNECKRNGGKHEVE